MSGIQLPSTKERLAKEQEYFGRQLADFIRRWKPSGESRDAYHFESETYFLIQRAQQLAQEPIMSAYTDLCASLPLAPLVLKAKP